MTNTNYRVIFNVEGLAGSMYEGIVGLEEIMKEELIRVYNIYADKTNGIADEYQRLVVDDFNKRNISPILDFLVDPEEIVFTGYLKVDKKVTINFYLKEVPEEES